MKVQHPMPFGAEIQPDGRVRFRLWAPAASSVDVCFEGNGREVVLSARPEADGWFGLVTDRVPVGGDYQYRIDGERRVPDPASRFQPHGVHGPSRVVDPRAWAWQDADWRGRPWREAVIYELHVGAFSAAGTFDGVRAHLDYLADLGVTAIELMPVAAFPGRRNWGYDGVLPFAPDRSYGRPEALKALVQAAHARGLMVLLDVVYNHFGPEGNYLHVYAPEFFTDRHRTPWGAAINFDGARSRVVRDFFIHNALYWLEEYRCDGLRLDAVHAIHDDSSPDLLTELAQAVHAGPGRERRVHLVLENDANQARYLERDAAGDAGRYTGQWNDDVHHAVHVLLTGEDDGYYADYADRPAWRLGRGLAEGFSFQGEPSPHRGGAPRGEPSARLPPAAFVNFLQTHDQVGNRAFGERIGALAHPAALQAAIATILLAPAAPLLFMGEEFGAAQPFLFFCDFGPDLAAAVTEGRRREFARFAPFAAPEARERIPDPNAETAFLRSRLDWSQLNAPAHAAWREFHRRLLAVRRRHVTPRVDAIARAQFETLSAAAVRADWFTPHERLTVAANFGDQPAAIRISAGDQLLYATPEDAGREAEAGRLPGRSMAYWLNASATGAPVETPR